MLLYITVILSILLLAFFFSLPQEKKLPKYFFIVPSFIILFVVSAFRGDFTSDYTSYVQLFTQYNSYGFFEVTQAGFPQESGFILLNRLIGLFTDNPIYLFIVTSFIILYAFYYQFNKYSNAIWLSVLLFVTIGSFYTSFNIMRHILAVAIVFSGSKYLYERKMLKYFLVILVAAFFHRTSLIMLIFYFILNFSLKPKNIVILFIFAFSSYFYLEPALNFIQRYIYTGYTYGMEGLSIKSVVVPLSLLIFGLFHHKKIDPNSTTHRIWMNALIFYALFSVLGASVQMVQRLAEFFAPYIWLLIPLIISKIKFDYLKPIYIMGLVSLLFLYNYVVYKNTGYDPYYFIWDKL